MGKTLNIELSESTYEKVVNEAKGLDRSVRKMVSLLVERGLEPKPEPQPQAPVSQPQSSPYVYDWHNDPIARPQWQLDEINRLKNEKTRRVNELGREKDDNLREYMEQEGWTQEEAEAIAKGYDQQIKDVEKEMEEQISRIMKGAENEQ